MRLLLEYKDARIEALLERISQLEAENDRVTGFALDLCDEECPNEYKNVVKREIFGATGD